jgi:tetratricopeptide (TPR) repeat protein
MKRRVPFLLGFALFSLACSLNRENTPYQDHVVELQKRRVADAIARNDFTAAIATLDTLTKTRPQDSDLWEMSGDVNRHALRFDAAVKAYEQAIRLNYGAYEPHMKLGTLLMEQGKTGRALAEFELAVKAEDRDVLARYNYGLALYEFDRRDEALAQWTVASEIDPTNARVAEALAMGYSGVSDTTAARHFERAQTLGADGAAFHNNYALLLDRLGRAPEAERHFTAAVAKAPADKRDEYRRNYALHLLRAGRNDDAEKLFGELVASGGGLWSDTVYLARAQMALQKYDDAIATLEPLALDVESGKVSRQSARIDRMPPTLDEALDILGMSWRGKGDKKRAVDYLKRAVALDPDDTSHLNNYGVVLAEGGMLPEARAQWHRVLELEPQNATAKANLSAFGR